MKFVRSLFVWCLVGSLQVILIRPALPHNLPSASQSANYTDLVAPMKPLQVDDVKRCGLSLLYPSQKNWYDEEIKLGCTGSYKEDRGTSLGIDYSRYPNDPERTSRYISMGIHPTGIDDWLATGSGHDTAFEQTGSDVRLLPQYSFGNGCHNLLRTVITPISGANWHGWIAEEVYGKASSRRNNDYCKTYAPKNRCVHLLIGNEKMSGELTSTCLLRRRTANLAEGFSYDIFMQMIKSIHFNEE
ncbi:hypothetical protein [Paraburkholderia sp. D1E]|uniref:hypothetical protein n=1 Tax=Paraburkholderia sp. D1E TaxID=3461398 RepID=UPI0040453E01